MRKGGRRHVDRRKIGKVREIRQIGEIRQKRVCDRNAGGELSSNLSWALSIARDGIGTAWNGTADSAPRPYRRGLDYLTPALRGDLIDQELISALEVTPGSKAATVTARPASTLVTIHRPDDCDFAAQMPVLRCYAELREDRLPEILEQTDDILSFFGMIVQLDDANRRWTLELVEAVVRLCIAVEMPLKHGFLVPRPNAFSHRIQPPIQTPAHAAYPSGHATEAYAVATVLAALADDAGTRTMLMEMAFRIAENRQVAGVHFPHDSLAGAVLGISLGEWVVAAAQGAQFPTGRKVGGFPVAGVNGKDSFTAAAVAAALTAAATGTASAAPPVLAEFWKNARAEWAGAAQ